MVNDEIYDYKDADIQFLPDSVVQQLNQGKLTADLPQIHDSFSGMISTEILSKNGILEGHDFIPYIDSINEYFHSFW